MGIHFPGCPTCPHDNQETITDASGRFTLPGIETGGFTRVVQKPGYDATSYNIAQLPRDAHPDIAVSPTAGEVRLDIQGTNVCAEHPQDRFFPFLRLMAELPVHHDGFVRNMCGFEVTCGGAFDIGVTFFLYRIGPNGQPIQADFSASIGGLPSAPVQGGYKYYYSGGGDFESCPSEYNYSIKHPR